VAPGIDGEEIQPRHTTVDAALRYGIDLAEYAERRGFSGTSGAVLTVDLPLVHGSIAEQLPWQGLASTILLVGIGQGEPSDLRRAGSAIAQAAVGRGTVVATLGAGLDRAAATATRALVEGYLAGCYTVPRGAGDGAAQPANAARLGLSGADSQGGRRTRGEGRHRPRGDEEQRHGELILLGKYDAGAIADGQRTARATWLTRDLANIPGNVKTPERLAAWIARLGAAAALDVEVWEPERLRAEGFGALLGVGGGSAYGPRLAVVRYAPEGARRHAVLVGKGVTFDTGGLNLKPRAAMETMKTDMAGAAAAFAAVRSAADAGLAVRVTAVLPLAENAFGGASMRPDDVLTAYGGQRVEVGNTDAEGRLILADALAWTDAVLEPDAVVDVATLTGAARIGLGTGMAALFANRDGLARVLSDAGAAAGEPVWRLPLAPDYRAATASAVADRGATGRGADPSHPFTGAGAVTAALFLEAFVGRRAWAHLDIAGPARADKDRLGVTRGATGFGAALLVRALEALAQSWPDG
jgi:leucyl aminopeptidase